MISNLYRSKGGRIAALPWEQIAIFIILLISFFNYSERFFPLLNSDLVITILMSMDFSFPEDLYFWGQNRLGSIVSLLSFTLVKLLKIHPVIAVSIVKYGILIAGYFGFSSFFTKSLSKILLALIWFLPPFHLLGFVLHVFGIQLSLAGIGIFYVNKLGQSLNKGDLTNSHLLIVGSCLFLGLALWVSDPSIISIGVLGIMAVYGTNKFLETQTFSLPQLTSIFLHFSFWIGLTFSFVFFAKQNAAEVPNYVAKLFNNTDEFLSALSIFWESIYQIAIFKSESSVESVYLYGVIFLIGFLIYYWSEIPYVNSLIADKWGFFFLLNFFLFIGLVFLSHWVLENGVARRYFTMAYAYGWISLIYCFDKGIRSKFKNTLKWIVLSVVLIGNMSGFIGFYFPKRIPPKIEVLAGFNTLGNVGLIGEYWNSYVSACPNPFKIKATPCDTAIVRNKKMALETLSQPRLFLIKDMWLDSFPKLAFQYDTTLLKIGKPINLGGAEICEYKVDVCRKFNSQNNELRSSCKMPKSDIHSFSGKVFYTDSNAFKSHFIFGPYISLDPGNYELKMRLKIDESYPGEKVLGYLDVASKGNVIKGRNIVTTDFNKRNAFEEITLKFNASERLEKTEFRILFYGGPKLTFDFMRLYKI